ncbi:stonustoxin subunit beta-like [Clupea harengus]|uniref:Stonustoxin subunit beta-like n=1 Tax=Clupea harengus TaxID=7950 RepID=A0A6P8ESX3_CLUHA|nr:stonustoxin subunit beta-like [Clupea harengus]
MGPAWAFSVSWIRCPQRVFLSLHFCLLLSSMAFKVSYGQAVRDSVLVTSAFSRPLDLGTLYDARNDRLIPGISLWKTEDFNSKTLVSPRPTTSFQVGASKSLSEKTSLLDVSASLKASFLGGLLTVGGSASYLKQRTSSSRQCSVTLKYHVTTEFKELMISELGTPNPEVFDKTDATHVVSGVLYGADALMEFQETASDNSRREEIEGNLDLMIKKIPSFSIEGQGSLKMNDDDSRMVQNFRCKFYGDIQLKELPSTFLEAIDVYKMLPSLLGDKGEKAVPVKVWLYPLSKLTNTESKLKRLISETLVSAVEKVMDDLHLAEVRTNDLLKSSTEIKAEEIVHKLEEFQSRLRVFTTEFLRKLSDLIPAIRGGDLEETALRDLLKSQDASGFSGKEMEQWLDGKESEINVVTKIINKLRYYYHIKIKPQGPELDSFLIDVDVKDAVVFSFTSLSNEEPYLKKISKAVEYVKSGYNISTPEQDRREEVPWYKRPDIWETLHHSIRIFINVPVNNKVISFISDPEHPGASVRGYRNAALNNPHLTHRLQLWDCKLTLDPNTAHKRLLLSEGNRTVTSVQDEQPYPDHPDRFVHWHNVLSREPLVGRCYWEFELGRRGARMGVAYQSIKRKGYIYSSLMGQGVDSWCLYNYLTHYNAYHNGHRRPVHSPTSGSKRVGVLLDRKACTLSFYSVYSDTLTHLYTFYTRFTDEPLYAAFMVHADSSVTMH